MNIKNTLKYTFPLALALAPTQMDSAQDNYIKQLNQNHYNQNQIEIQKQIEKKSQLEKYFNQTDSIENIIPTKYINSSGKPLKNQCSKYVRRAAKDLFGIKYSYSNAWDRKYNDKVLYEFKEKHLNQKRKIKTLDSLFNSGKLERGAVFAFYYPRSKHNKPGRDETHVELFAGKDKKGHYITLGNRGKIQGASYLKKLQKKGFYLTKILVPKEDYLSENSENKPNKKV